MTRTVERVTPQSRFMRHVEQTDTCWLWTGYLKPNGYASFYPGGGRHVSKVYAHRWAYEYFNGTIPDGMEIDHLCGVRHCVNPAHLEAVSRRENLDRRNEVNGWERMRAPGLPRVLKTHCKHGHEFSEENTYHHGGYRYCRACRRGRNAAR